MMRNSLFYSLGLLIILSGCIKPYTPNLDENAVNKYVIQGMVSSVEGYQIVNVSTSSDLYLAFY